MRGCAALAWRELRAQRVTSVLILLAVILSTTMTAAIGQSLGTLNALRLQQAASLNGNRHVTLHNLTAEQAQAISADERVAFAGRITALGTCRLENSSLTLLLREYDGGALSAYSASLKLAEGALPRAAGEIALPRDVLTLLGYSGGPGATLVLPLQISRIQDAAPSYSYTAEFTLTGIFESSYVGYVSRSVAGAAGPGSAAELLPERYQVYSLDLRLREPERLQETVDDLAGQFDLPQACIQYNDTLLDALGVSYRGKGASDAGGAGVPYLACALWGPGGDSFTRWSGCSCCCCAARASRRGRSWDFSAPRASRWRSPRSSPPTCSWRAAGKNWPHSSSRTAPSGCRPCSSAGGSRCSSPPWPPCLPHGTPRGSPPPPPWPVRHCASAGTAAGCVPSAPFPRSMPG